MKPGDRIPIEVGPKAIANAKPGHTEDCLIGMGIQHTYPGAWSVAVKPMLDTRFNWKEQRIIGCLDGPSVLLAAGFDKDKGEQRPEPFTAWLVISEVKPVRRVGSRQARGLPPKRGAKTRPFDPARPCKQTRGRYHAAKRPQ